ncbi:MAG: succinyldiaminopimelate transaminase [Steroidobacteraceae bacterium]
MNPRLELLLPYPFERLRQLLKGAKPPAGLPHISMSIGEPRHAPPDFILDALRAALPTIGSYPSTLGIPELRTAGGGALMRRYGLPTGSLDPETMVLPVTGTREALFAFVQTVVNDKGGHPAVVMPNPFYQIYEGAALLAGAEPVFLNATADNQYLPDLHAVPDATWKRCQLLFLCNPGNPTGAVMNLDYLRTALELAERHDFVIAADECYADLYPDDNAPPPGLLQAALAAGHSRFERCVVFHSLSKRSSVPGLRSGIVAGDPALLKSFLLYRTYHGSAMPPPTQLASVLAWNDDAHVAVNRDLYRQKFREVGPILGDLLDVKTPEGGFYYWPHVGDDERFTRELFEQQHLTLLPGSYLARDTATGNPGRGRVRISLVASVDECVVAARRIREFLLARPPST